MGNLLEALRGNPASGIGAAGNPTSGIGVLGSLFGGGGSGDGGSSDLLSMLLGKLGGSVFGQGGLSGFIGGVPGPGGYGDG